MDVRTLPSIEQGIKIRDVQGSSTLISYCPGNGTKYLILITDVSHLGPESKDFMGLGSRGWGWLVTHVGHTPMTSMVVIDNGALLHWEYVREKLSVSISDAVVLAELIGFVTNRSYISSDDFLKSV